MALLSSSKTSWINLLLIIALTVVAIYVIWQAMNASLVDWQTFNNVRAADVRDLLDE